MSKIPSFNNASSPNSVFNNRVSFSAPTIIHADKDNSLQMPQDVVSISSPAECQNEEESLEISINNTDVEQNDANQANDPSTALQNRENDAMEEKEPEQNNSYTTLDISWKISPKHQQHLQSINNNFGSSIEIKNIDEAYEILTTSTSNQADKVTALVYVTTEAANGNVLPKTIFTTITAILNDPTAPPNLISLSLALLTYAATNQDISKENLTATAKYLGGNNSNLAVMAIYQQSKTYVANKKEMPPEVISRVCTAIAVPPTLSI